MAAFASLPIELQYQCVQYFDIETLKQFRLASRKASLIGKEYLFDTVVLTFDESSAESFNHVLEDDALRAIVKKVIVDDTEGNMENEFLNDEYDEEEEAYVHQATPWSNAISKMAQFPNLRDAEIWFCEECVDTDFTGECLQDPEYRELYQNRFFEALKDAQGVQSLTLKNMQDMIVTTTGSEEAIEAVRGRLKRFAILVATEDCDAAPEHQIESEELHSCFNSLLKVHWLNPLQTQLTHLTVYSDFEWGIFPFMDVREIHFPNLVSLALGKWTVAHDWQFDWITSHGATLEELILDDVAISYIMWMEDEMVEANWPDMRPWKGRDTVKLYSTRWHEVFPKFQQQLPKLRHFRTEHEGWQTFSRRYDLLARIKRPRYTLFNGACWDDNADRSTYRNEDKVKIAVDHPGADQEKKDHEALKNLLKSLGKTEEEIENMRDLEWNDDEKRWDFY
ncbi:hypothetical protein N0V90_001556 [Kalmusia sp. IMI 367209]|nr:hypothetical protein N0V90_001556 [Kalmusia sp. IMI 367209]